MKINGLSNLRIITILFITSILIGIFTVLIYYNAASKLKFLYTDIKNKFSNDNKYLAVVTESGLWLKDEIYSKTLIVKATSIEKNYLINVIINEFDENFDLINTIQSEKIDINEEEWIIDKPIITKNNITKKDDGILIYVTNFNKEKN